jgi:hypothetical protein
MDNHSLDVIAVLSEVPAALLGRQVPVAIRVREQNCLIAHLGSPDTRTSRTRLTVFISGQA